MIWFWLAVYPSWYCPLRTGGGFFLLNEQNLLSMAKVIFRYSLKTWRKLYSSYIIKVEVDFESSTWTVEVIRTRFPCPGLLDFLRNLFFKKKKKSEIWGKYGQWCYRFKLLEGIRLQCHWQWLFDVDFGEIRLLKWHDEIISNSWFLAILKEFSEGLPLLKLIYIFFFIKWKEF